MKFAQITVLMYYISYVGDLPMREIVAFFKKIFFMNNNNEAKVGLSQFKSEQETPIEKKKLELKSSKDIKISDLMRRSA